MSIEPPGFTGSPSLPPGVCAEAGWLAELQANSSSDKKKIPTVVGKYLINAN
jgi:hypothetical protein